MSGWIKLHRSLSDKGWYNKPDYVSLWIHLLMMASHKRKEYFWNGKLIILEPGQLISGRSELSKKTGINPSKVERILRTFKIEQQIEQRTTSTSRLISIVNYQKFQSSEQPFEQRVNSEWTASEQRVNTNKERKEYKELKKKGAAPIFFEKPNLDEVCNFFMLAGFEKSLGERAFNHYSSLNWLDSNGNEVKDWKKKMEDIWFKESDKIKPNNSVIQSVKYTGSMTDAVKKRLKDEKKGE